MINKKRVKTLTFAEVFPHIYFHDMLLNTFINNQLQTKVIYTSLYNLQSLWKVKYWKIFDVFSTVLCLGLIC
jgi:hypothetical protein